MKDEPHRAGARRGAPKNREKKRAPKVLVAICEAGARLRPAATAELDDKTSHHCALREYRAPVDASARQKHRGARTQGSDTHSLLARATSHLQIPWAAQRDTHLRGAQLCGVELASLYKLANWL